VYGYMLYNIIYPYAIGGRYGMIWCNAFALERQELLEEERWRNGGMDATVGYTTLRYKFCCDAMLCYATV
jgi:hypothetical protein